MTLPATAHPQSIVLATSAACELTPLQRLLTPYHFELSPVSRGDSALDAVRAGGVALVLLDVTLAGSASFELCLRLSTLPGHAVPVLLLSAAPSEDEQQRALAAGARGYLALPLQVESAVQQILNVLGVCPTAPAATPQPTGAHTLRDGENQVLKMIARGASLQETLDQLMRMIEAQTDGVQCSIMALAEDGESMTPASAPSLPASYLEALRGTRIGPMVGSCGTAMWRREPVIVNDLEHDPLWTPYRQLAGAHGLKACWSVPIFDDEGAVVASFAMYYRTVRSPTPDDLRLISSATHLAGIALSTERRKQELQRHREHLEELVASRTAELRLAKEQAERSNDELSTALHNLSMTQTELVRRDKLAALGELVAGVAHELSTPISNSLMMASSIQGRTEELRTQLAHGLRRSVLDSYVEQAANADDVIVRNLRRAAELLESFKRTAMDAANSQRCPFLLDQLVASLVLPIQASGRCLALTIQQDIAPNLSMDSYPEPLAQVLNQLLDNALVHGFAGRHSGLITLRARPGPSGDINLTLQDDGVGIPADAMGRLYNPFFKVRPGSPGAGLGLYSAHNIVCGVLGGQIETHSEEGRGTTVTLALPANAPL